MRRDGDIVSCTSDKLREKRERGEDLTDWERVKSLTDEEIEAAIDYEGRRVSSTGTTSSWGSRRAEASQITLRAGRRHY